MGSVSPSSSLRMARPIRIAQRALQPGARLIAASPGETVENWLVRNGQTPRICEMLWEPLAVAALNESIDVASASPFARVLTEMLGGNSRDASIGLPLKPLDEMYALPARDYIERHGGEVRTTSPARLGGGADLSDPRVTVRHETFTAPIIICPWSNGPAEPA